MASRYDDLRFKILLAGDAGVGKSCLMARFSGKTWTPSYVPTIGVEFCSHIVPLDARYTCLQIWDTAGQERFRTITHSYYRGSDGIIILYDVTDRSTYDNAQQWWLEARSLGSCDVAMLLVGTKCELVSKRQVEYEEGEAFAAARGMAFIESSAAADENVDQVFMQIAADMKRRVLVRDAVSDAHYAAHK